MKYKLLILSLFFAISISAQDVLSLMKLNLSNTLVEQAVNDGAFFVSHSYQICETTTMQKFGRYGSDIFGSKSGIAIKVKGGYILPKFIVTPWDYDENFTKYKGKYTPVTFKIKRRNFSDSTAICLNNDTLPAYKPIPGTEFCFIADSISFSGDGFSPCLTSGNKSGWCIWYTTPNGIDNIDSIHAISTVSTKYELEIKSSENSYTVEIPKTGDEIIGGIFVVPTTSSIGNLTFELAGIMSYIDETWKILTPFFEFNVEEELSPVTEIIEAVEKTKEVVEQKKEEGTKQKKKQKK